MQYKTGHTCPKQLRADYIIIGTEHRNRNRNPDRKDMGPGYEKLDGYRLYTGYWHRCQGGKERVIYGNSQDDLDPDSDFDLENRKSQQMDTLVVQFFSIK